jgi:hypothetical protein
MSSGDVVIDSDHYLNRIKNETNRIKQRQQRVYEEYIRQHHPESEQSLSPSVSRGETTANQEQQSRTTSQTRQHSLVAKTRESISSWRPDIDEQEDSASVVLQPPDRRGESSSKLDAEQSPIPQQQPQSNRKTSFRDLVPIRNMSSHLQPEHEAFRKKLIDDVLGDQASDRVPMEKVVMLIWQYRDDAQVVRFMTRFVAKVRFSTKVYR